MVDLIAIRSIGFWALHDFSTLRKCLAMEFGGNVILLGKAYFREIRALRVSAGPKARPSVKVEGEE